MQEQEKESKGSPPGLLFADENMGNFGSPEPAPGISISAQQFFQRVKSPIRRLNFDNESQNVPHNPSSVPVEVNKVAEFKQFSASHAGTAEQAKIKAEEEPQSDNSNKESENGARFYQLRSSPMQMFNSFSPNAAAYLSQTIGPKGGRGGLIYSDGKLTTRKTCCNCKKSHCLKLYCECFSNKTYCGGCNCINCLNTRENEAIREKAMQATLDRNPIAFDPKITQAEGLVHFYKVSTRQIGYKCFGSQHKFTARKRMSLQEIRMS